MLQADLDGSTRDSSASSKSTEDKCQERYCFPIADLPLFVSAVLPTCLMLLSAIVGNPLCKADNSASIQHAEGLITWSSYTVPWIILFLAFIYRRSKWLGVESSQAAETKETQRLSLSRQWLMRQFFRYSLLLLVPLTFATIILSVAPERVCLTPGLRLSFWCSTCVIAEDCAMRFCVLPVLSVQHQARLPSHLEVKTVLTLGPALHVISMGVSGFVLLLGSTVAAKVCFAFCLAVFGAATTCITAVSYIAWRLPGHAVVEQLALHPMILSWLAPLGLRVRVHRAAGASQGIFQGELAACVPAMFIISLIFLALLFSTFIESAVCLFEDHMVNQFENTSTELLERANACTHPLISDAPITHANGIVHVTLPVSLILVLLFLVASAWDSTFFRLAIADGHATQVQSESLLRWLSHECRSPVAAAMLSLDSALNDVVPALEAQILGRRSSSSPRTTVTPLLNCKAAGEWEELKLTMLLAQKPIQSLSHVLDNMLLYMRRERSLLTSAESSDQPWGNHMISLKSVFQAALQNARAIEGQLVNQGGTLHADGSVSVAVQHWVAGSDGRGHGQGSTTDGHPHNPSTTADLMDPSQLDCYRISSSVTFSTTVQLLTNYLSNAFKYGKDTSGNTNGCIVRFSLYSESSLIVHEQMQRLEHNSSPNVAFNISSEAAPHTSKVTPEETTKSRNDATLNKCNNLANQFRAFRRQISSAKRVAQALAAQASDKSDSGPPGRLPGSHGLQHRQVPNPDQPGVLLITVIDQGIGLSPADAELLFQPFARLRSGKNVQGNGLGLWLMKGLVESQGGSLGVYSESVGGGCAFAAALPVLSCRVFEPEVQQQVEQGSSTDPPDKHLHESLFESATIDSGSTEHK